MWPLIGLVNEMNRIMDSLDSVSQCCGCFFLLFVYSFGSDRVLLKCKHSGDIKVEMVISFFFVYVSFGISHALANSYV